MTLAEMQARVWQRLEENSADPARYPAADVLEYLNDAVQHIVSRAGLFTTTATLTQGVGVLFYALPTDCIVPESIHSTTGPAWLEPTNAYELDRGGRADANNRWGIQQSTVSRAYFPFGLNEVALWPRAGTDGETYTLTYRQDAGASTLSAAGDEPDIPSDYHEALVDYAVARCLLVDGDLARAEARMAAFSEVVASAKRRSEDAGRAWEPQRGVSLR